MNIVHLVVVETLSTLWNLEEPFAEISSFSLILGTKNLVKVGTQHQPPTHPDKYEGDEIEQNLENESCLSV